MKSHDVREHPSPPLTSMTWCVFTAVIEHVRDGCTVRAFLLPDFHYVTIMLSGIKVEHSQHSLHLCFVSLESWLMPTVLALKNVL